MTRRRGTGVTTGESPLIIGGMPGSGTRVYRTIAQAAGYEMLIAPLPERLIWRNHHDNQPMRKRFFPRWTDRLRAGPLSDAEQRSMRRDLHRALWICGPTKKGRGPWGWKNPRSMFLLPTWADEFPDARFVLVVRDGRDVAFNDRFSLVHHDQWVLSDEERSQPDEIRRGYMWARSNQLACEEAESLFPGRWCLSRLEDLCLDTDAELTRVWRFVTGDDRATYPPELRDEIRTPSTLGRWRSGEPDTVRAVEAAIGSELGHFGYGADAAGGLR